MIIHVDMDAFFASVEQRDRPELRGLPVIICGQSSRSVVSTASYEARRFGVRSAMPYHQALTLCPDGVFLKGRSRRYQEISREVFALLDQFSPLVEPVSIDEAYLDISGCTVLLGSETTIAARIKQAIFQSVHLTCSLGIAPVKFLAKIGSGMNKPDGITLISDAEMDTFIVQLPVEKVPGVGKVMLNKLHLLRLYTLGDVRSVSEKVLANKLGGYGVRLKQLSLGIDASTVKAPGPAKSISSETTLARDTGDKKHLKAIILKQSDEIAAGLRQKKVRAKTVFVKLTYANFKKISRQVTLPHPVNASSEIAISARQIVDDIVLETKVRLVGTGVSGFLPENLPRQADLFCPRDNRQRHWETLDKTVDTIAERFGPNAIGRASIRSSVDSQKKKN